MPPKLKTTSPEARLRSSVNTMSAGSSPRYWQHASSSPRAPSVSITFGRCLSCRFPDRSSSPMMMAPKRTSAVDVGLELLDRLLLFGDDLLHEIADRDQPDQIAVLDDGQMADAAVRHEPHAFLDRARRIDRDHFGGHDLAHLYVL